jgi:hypothetical protein
MAEEKRAFSWRSGQGWSENEKKRRLPKETAFCLIVTRKEEFVVLGRPGSDLLSQGLSHSTIGAEEFNGRVRDGIGFKLLARTTRPAKDKDTKQARTRSVRAQSPGLTRGPRSAYAKVFVSMDCRVKPGNDKETMDTENESNQANRTISTGKLHALLRFHTRPINVVVFHGSQGNTRFEVGFPLRCFQRLSRPYIAMQHCRWRDNCSTRGTFIPVLSY